MPLTPFQKQVAHIIAKNRSAESYVAGGAVINRDDGRLHISNNLDIFNDNAETVAALAEADGLVLREAGYTVEWTLNNKYLRQAKVTNDREAVRLNWTNDTAFRFFPPEPDADFGYCLHEADLATNKVLALVGRSEIRDFLDVLQLDQTYLSLGATEWAACGKDPGYSPDRLLDYANRHSRYQESDLAGENLVRPVSLIELKNQWVNALERARDLCARLPGNEIGCLYLNRDGHPVTPDPGTAAFRNLIRHFGSHHGAWLTIT
jgi:hypothetical protein